MTRNTHNHHGEIFIAGVWLTHEEATKALIADYPHVDRDAVEDSVGVEDEALAQEHLRKIGVHAVDCDLDDDCMC
jgi:hypothetical protein